MEHLLSVRICPEIIASDPAMSRFYQHALKIRSHSYVTDITLFYERRNTAPTLVENVSG
jgi:hypothetical protein